MDIYREEILDHYKNPRNWGVIKAGGVKAEASNSHCGDRIEMAIWLDKKKDRIKEIKFKGEGCAICLAAVSMLTEELRDRNWPKAGKITDKEAVGLLGVKLNPAREKCAKLGFEVWQKLIRKLT